MAYGYKTLKFLFRRRFAAVGGAADGGAFGQGPPGDSVTHAIQLFPQSPEFLKTVGIGPDGDCAIAIWAYPDSFEEFRRLRKELYRMGYRIAGRPLPEGTPIGGSPDGSKSAAE